MLCNELKQAVAVFPELRRLADWHPTEYRARPRASTTWRCSKELHEAAHSRRLYTYHFTILRSIMEKTATFHGYSLRRVMKHDPDDEDGTLHFRYVNILSHGSYSLFEPGDDGGKQADTSARSSTSFMNDYRFNPELVPRG